MHGQLCGAVWHRSLAPLACEQHRLYHQASINVFMAATPQVGHSTQEASAATSVRSSTLARADYAYLGAHHALFCCIKRFHI